MKNNLTLKRSSVRESSDVLETLNWKMNLLIEKKELVQEGLTDYVGFAIDDIDAEVKHAENIKRMITQKIKDLKEQKKMILEGSAKFMQQSGIDKMVGTCFSSITLTEEKAATTKEVFTLLATKKEVEEYLLDAGLAGMKEEEVPRVRAKGKLNRRKILIAEVEETDED